jgi:hypothetical protein
LLLLVGDQRLPAGSPAAPWMRCTIQAFRFSCHQFTVRGPMQCLPKPHNLGPAGGWRMKKNSPAQGGWNVLGQSNSELRSKFVHDLNNFNSSYHPNGFGTLIFRA